MGLRSGEIRGLQWEDYNGEEMQITRSIWRGKVTDTKTRKGRAPVPVIRQLAALLELQRIRCGNPKSGPIFPNSNGKPLALCTIANHSIVPFLNICKRCGKVESKHKNESREYLRDDRIPQWHGWHAARRGTRKQLVPPRRAGPGNPANPSPRKREHDCELLHQDGGRRCS